MIGFIIGVVIGVFLGMFIMGLCVAARGEGMPDIEDIK